jgi:hypothetical protein
MNFSEYFFIGNKNEPQFMLEVNRREHNIIIFKPDKYSKKMTDFFEKYYLGEILYEIVNYDKIIFIKDDAKKFDKIKDFNTFILSEILIKMDDEQYMLIKDDIYEN